MSKLGESSVLESVLTALFELQPSQNSQQHCSDCALRSRQGHERQTVSLHSDEATLLQANSHSSFEKVLTNIN